MLEFTMYVGVLKRSFGVMKALQSDDEKCLYNSANLLKSLKCTFKTGEFYGASITSQ
jgi:hypothetical protein